MMLLALERYIAIKGAPIPPVGESPFGLESRKARIGVMRQYTLNPSLRFVPLVANEKKAKAVSAREVGQ